MIPVRLALALACGLFVPPAAMAASPPPVPPVSEEAAEQSDDDKAQDSATEGKRICRYVKLDTASRRKTKICRTSDEWRELNNPR